MSNLSPITQALLFSEVALLLRNDIDNWTQVDFNDCRHTDRLRDCINTSISKITNVQGRPIHADMDEYLISLSRLYQKVTGHPGSAQAHYDNQPYNSFEHLLLLGFQITKPSYGYPTMLKAWQRALTRQT